MEKMRLFKHIKIYVAAFYPLFDLKNIIALLTVNLLAVFLSRTVQFNRDDVKSLAFAPINIMGT